MKSKLLFLHNIRFRFDMDRQCLIEFNNIVVTKASKSEHMMNRVMPRDNIALCAVLKIKDSVYSSRNIHFFQYIFLNFQVE